MFRLVARAVLVAAAALSLAACSRTRPASEVPQVYDIRAVVVAANAGVPRLIVRNVKSGLDKAAAATVRPVPLPRAIMDVRLVSVAKAQTLDGVRGQAEVSVVLSEASSAHPMEVKNYMIMSFTQNVKSSDAALAEAIAARLRYEYKLAIPQIRIRQSAAPVISTRMSSEDKVNEDKTVETPADKPLIIPLKTAPVVGADQDPILNSKTKVAPAKEPAKMVVDPAAQKPVPAENALEGGAKAKVVIMPKKTETAPADAAPVKSEPVEQAPVSDEPCVETLEKKCQ